LASTALGQWERWDPPTSADWKKPPLIQWQRNLDDALAVSKATGRPLLVCVNMDGEAASENYAGARYRDPEFAKWANAYVPLMVSVDRHNARDYDDSGRRIPCPRFGRVTCGEHIDLEPIAYDKFFNSQRVAPRHIGVATDGKILFDCFLNFDVSPVVKALKDHAAAAPPAAGDRSLEERVHSCDAGDRAYVEATFSASDAATKKKILAIAERTREGDIFDVLRMALLDADESVRAAALRTLAATANVRAVPMLVEAARAARDTKEKDALMQILVPLAKDNSRARALAIVYRALRAKSSTVKLEDWETAFAKPLAKDTTDIDTDTLEKTMQEATARVKSGKDDGSAPVAFADAAMQFYEIRAAAGKDASFVLDEAAAMLDAAGAAQKSKAAHRLVRGRIEAYKNNLVEAAALLKDGIHAALSDASSAGAYHALRSLARGNWAMIAKSLENANEWPAEWLTDADAAFRAAEKHPLAEPTIYAMHYDLLNSLDAADEAGRVLDAGLAAKPDAPPLHERYRARLLQEKGIAGLSAAYEALVQKHPDSAPHAWFAGYAMLVAAEYHKRLRDDASAKAAYGRSLALFAKSGELNANYGETANHYIAMAYAGRSRIALDEGDLAASIDAMVAALQQKPEIYEMEDGLGRSPRVTLNALRWTLDDRKESALRERLESALEKIGSDLASRPAK
jgi:hypothetical protein